jgi:signal transduction histidine kinase
MRDSQDLPDMTGNPGKGDCLRARTGRHHWRTPGRQQGFLLSLICIWVLAGPWAAAAATVVGAAPVNPAHQSILLETATAPTIRLDGVGVRADPGARRELIIADAGGTLEPSGRQTPWLLLALLSGILLAAAVLTRFRALLQRQQELEQQVVDRTAELHQRTDELSRSNQALALSADTLRQLGTIGQEITATLDPDAVFRALYRHVGRLLHAPNLSIYQFNDGGTALVRVFGLEDDAPLPRTVIRLDDPSSFTARAARQRQDILREIDPDQPNPNHIPGTRRMATLLFTPLIVDDRVLGVMSIQSDRSRAYGDRERLIIRTLCSYGAIALANAAVYSQVEAARAEAASALNALQETQAQLVQQEKMAALGGLVVGMAHEVNTPLGNVMMAITGFSKVISDLQQASLGGRLTRVLLEEAIQESAELADLADRNAKRVASLVGSFKTVAVQGDTDCWTDVDLAVTVADTVDLIAAELARDGHRLSLAIPHGLTVTTRPQALAEALNRILANVRDHAFMGGNTQGRVELTAERMKDGSTRVCIDDNGKGVPAEILPKLMDPFFTTKRGIGGHVGLGLHVVFNLVTQGLGGTISISSRQGNGTQGQGTQVCIVLPATPQHSTVPA